MLESAEGVVNVVETPRLGPIDSSGRSDLGVDRGGVGRPAPPWPAQAQLPGRGFRWVSAGPVAPWPPSFELGGMMITDSIAVETPAPPGESRRSSPSTDGANPLDGRLAALRPDFISTVTPARPAFVKRRISVF